MPSESDTLALYTCLRLLLTRLCTCFASHLNPFIYIRPRSLLSDHRFFYAHPCIQLIHHTNQLDVLAGLLSTLLPGSMAGTIPPPSWPHGYPVLFPTQASASGSSYRKPDFLPSSQQPYGGVRQAGLHHNPSALGYTLDSGYYTTRQADMYALAANNVRNYVREGAQLPEENRIKQHIKKQRQDASLQLGGRAKASNANSHMPTSEHKNRGGRPVPNPGLAGYPSLSSYGATAGGSSSLMAPSLSMGTSASTQGPMISSGSLLQSTGHSVNGGTSCLSTAFLKLK